MRRMVLAACSIALLVPVAASPGLAGAADVEILVLSNRADLLSGGDALVEVVVPAGLDVTGLTVDVDGCDVTGVFAVRDDGRFYGRVTGLDVGANRIVATLPDGSGAYLDVVNHPVGGPVIAGPQVQPWTCATEESGLGPAQDAQCNGSTIHTFHYKSTATQRFQAYDPASPPPDVAMTTTDEGETVPYVVRVERGTIDRGVYEIAVLFDPDAAWEPWAPQPQWNRKLYWVFGGDCKPWHVQTAPPGDSLPGDVETLILPTVLHDLALSRGFAVASSGLNTLGQNCNDVVSAEAAMMVKEHLVEAYGEVRYTMSQGASGGSMQQHWIAANYPGLLDGIQPSASYPDIWETLQTAEDCHLLNHVFDAVSPQLWLNPDDQAEAAGHAAASVCRSLWDNPSGSSQYSRTWLDPDYAEGCGLDPAAVYDPDANPTGARCTLQDYQVALFGRRAVDGFANRPFDNVGVEYGLTALERGEISVEQFVDLNEHAGGLTIDWEYQPERSVADPAALRRAYLGGRVTSGFELDRVPIMDLRGTSNYEIHNDVYTYSTEARLIAANGHADNQVRWNSSCTLAPCVPLIDASFLLLDGWLGAIEADGRDVSLEQKVLEQRPVDAVDACFVGDVRITDQQQCDVLLPHFAAPRLAAGAPTSDDVLKCQLAPLDRAGYAVEFSDALWARMEAAFPDGVCDYTRPGVGQQPPRGPWQTYAGGPDGRPLGAPPVSVPFGPEGPPGLVSRHGGADRVETAVAVSGLGVATAETVVIARADEFPDALAGGPLAVHLRAPLLLSRSDALSPAVAEEVRRLGASAAVLLGGEAALAPQVAVDLEALGVTVGRVAGPDRFATAAAIAAQLPATGEVLLARGDAFPDALAASGLGAATGTPVLLTGSEALPDVTAAALAPDTAVTIVGGPAAIGEQVATAVDAAAGDVRRLAGATRYATSVAVADDALAQGHHARGELGRDRPRLPRRARRRRGRGP